MMCFCGRLPLVDTQGTIKRPSKTIGTRTCMLLNILLLFFNQNVLLEDDNSNGWKGRIYVEKAIMVL